MKIQYASDLHLEFGENSSWLKKNPQVPSGEILVLAGDIGYLGDDNYSRHPFWNWAADNFSRTIVIPGNHEFYKGSDINQFIDGWEKEIRSNVKVVYNQAIPLTEKTDLIATTLWSSIPSEYSWWVERGVSDFHRIRNGEFRLSSNRFNEEHRRCLVFLLKELGKRPDKKVVVATHHVPSYQLMSPEFEGSTINGAFTVELEKLIEAHPQITHWIYGHSHRNINKVIGTTHCVSNQLGYVFANEHTTFNPRATIEIE